MGTRDDFNPEVKDVLAKRVGARCSNPNCRQTTSGPREVLNFLRPLQVQEADLSGCAVVVFLPRLNDGWSVLI